MTADDRLYERIAPTVAALVETSDAVQALPMTRERARVLLDRFQRLTTSLRAAIAEERRLTRVVRENFPQTVHETVIETVHEDVHADS